MSERPISAIIFAMYDCEDCARRFAVEDKDDEPEVRCPACGSFGVDYVDHGRVTPVEWVLDCLEKREEAGERG